MKILLAMPTWTDDLGAFRSIGRTRNPQVPLGLLYLATIAQKKGHQVEFVDCDVECVSGEEVADRVVRGRFDLVGLSATSPIFHKAVKTAEAIRAKAPWAKLVIGGEHINYLKGQVFYEPFDIGVYGEAEETWPELLDRIESTRTDLADIDGVIWRRDGEVVQNAPRRLFPDLDQLPHPAIHLTKIDLYKMTFALWKNRNIGKYVSIMMTRGCPFKCTFCSESSAVKFGGKILPVRFRSPGHIVEEMETHFKNHDVRHFFFMDSNISLRKSHMTELCELLIKKNLPITFEGWTRANLVTDDLMKLMARAGLRRLSCGVESGDPEILKIIKKDVPQEATRKFFKLIKKYDIEPTCSAMLGNPGETRESIMNTINFLDSIPEILYTNFSIANPYPGTEMLMWAQQGKHGLRLRFNDLSKYTRYEESPIEVNDLTSADLVRYQYLGLLKIHMRPTRFIAAVRMLGFWDLLPVFIKMVRRVSREWRDVLKVFFPSLRRASASPPPIPQVDDAAQSKAA